MSKSNHQRSSQGLRARLRDQRRQTEKSRAALIRDAAIEIQRPTGLYLRLRGQLEAEPVYLTVDLRDRRMWCWVRSNGGVVRDRYTEPGGLQRHYRIAPLTDAAAAELMRSVSMYAQRMVDGCATEWQNGRPVAELSRHARTAERRLAAIIEDSNQLPQVRAWHLEMFDQYGYKPEHFDITASTTDADLDAIESEIMDSDPEITVWDGLREHLEDLRKSASGGAA